MCMQLNHLPGLEGEVVTNKIFDQRGLRLRVALGAKEPTVTGSFLKGQRDATRSFGEAGAEKLVMPADSMAWARALIDRISRA